MDQVETWRGDFGRRYTDRNIQSPGEMDALYKREFGISRFRLIEEFLGDVDRATKILEVGTNVGIQLQSIQNMGFRNLYGVEPQAYAIKKARQLTENIEFIQGDVFNTPFKNDFFGLIFTSGVLIHISPDNILKAIKEIYRCSSRYIWGHEYFSEEHTAVPYRGRSSLLWKADFARIYLDTFPDLRLAKEKKIPCLKNEDRDSIFLLEKTR